MFYSIPYDYNISRSSGGARNRGGCQVVNNLPFGRWNVRVRADFGRVLPIFADDVDRRRSPASAVQQDRHEILFLAAARVQQVARDGREIEEGSFHVSTVSLFFLLRRPFHMCVCVEKTSASFLLNNKTTTKM